MIIIIIIVVVVLTSYCTCNAPCLFSISISCGEKNKIFRKEGSFVFPLSLNGLNTINTMPIYLLTRIIEQGQQNSQEGIKRGARRKGRAFKKIVRNSYRDGKIIKYIIPSNFWCL